MSIRTLVEINHDRLGDIEADPQEFVKRLTRAIQAGGLYADAHDRGARVTDAHARLWMAGAKIKHQRHHTNDCPTEEK